MTVSPNPTRDDWKKRLPVSVVDWIEKDLHRSFADLTQISLDARPLPINYVTSGGWKNTIHGPALTHYTFTFSDGTSFQADVDPLSALWMGKLINGYNDIITPRLWIDRYIMQEKRAEGEAPPDYGLNLHAYTVVAHLLKRGQSDPLATCFARKLVNDTSVNDEVLFMMVKMDLFATKYTASQICTAAYQAYNEVEREQANG